tara:strand:- start:329 stop:628 length:300 start_codon:yes stop_codon:yes gene_type:complete
MPKLKILPPKPFEEEIGRWGRKVLSFDAEFYDDIWEYYDPHLYRSKIKWGYFVLIEVVKDQEKNSYDNFNEVFIDKYAIENGFEAESRFSKKMKEKWGI